MSTESRTERITVRWPVGTRHMIEQRAKARMRSVSAEVRELLTFARNSVDPQQMVSMAPYHESKSTSVSITPRLRHWLMSRAQYNDRSIQIELVSLVNLALEEIMERDLLRLSEQLEAGPVEHAPE